MINGRRIAPPGVVRALARQLGLDPDTLEGVAADLRQQIKREAK